MLVGLTVYQRLIYFHVLVLINANVGYLSQRLFIFRQSSAPHLRLLLSFLSSVIGGKPCATLGVTGGITGRIAGGSPCTSLGLDGNIAGGIAGGVTSGAAGNISGGDIAGRIGGGIGG